MAEPGILGTFARGWRGLGSAGPRRLALTGVLMIAALLLARFTWLIPGTDEAEASLYDLRAYLLAEQVEQDERILLVVYDDQTLIAARKRSPLARDVLAEALRNLDAMGARAIGIDILFDQPQDEDEELIETLRAMRTPTYVGYAEMDTNAGEIIYEQQEFLESFLARLEGTNARPASVRLDETAGATRLWPSIEPGLPPVLGRAMLAGAGDADKTMPGYTGAIRYREQALEDVPVYTSIPIGTFADPEIAAALAPVVAGRYVLIGGDIVDYDRVVTTFTAATGETPPGLEVHAEMIAQMLDGQALPKPLPIALWAAALLVVLAAALTAMIELRSWKMYPVMAFQLAALVAVPFALQWRGVDTYGLPAAGWLLGWVVALTAVTSAARASTAVQRRFAQGALGKYLPRSIAQEIIDHPERLSLHGENKEIFVLFSDLEGFTKMSHAIPPETVAKLLNR